MGKRVVIIGGGAAGLMAGLAASGQGAQVTLLEQNDRPGRKLLATGNGRCNFTNQDQDLSHYHSRNPMRVADVLARFSVKETLDYFRELGICPKERKGWYYPNSEQAQAVLDVMLMELSFRKVKLKTREHVTQIQKHSDGTFTVWTDGWHYDADSVILTTGSGASSVTGSTSEGISLLQTFGIRSLPFLPALCPLSVSGISTSAWAGVRLQGCFTACDETTGEVLGTSSGEIQLTEKGISGIPVFQLSGACNRVLAEGHRVRGCLDFLPDFSKEELLRELTLRRERAPYKTLAMLLVGLLPDKLIRALLQEPDPTAAGRKKKKKPEYSLEDAVSLIKTCSFRVEGQKDIRQGQVCQGGVCFEELTEDLELVRVPGLYLAGELIDVNGDCGGYNLQWAWSSGQLAGNSAAM